MTTERRTHRPNLLSLAFDRDDEQTPDDVQMLGHCVRCGMGFRLLLSLPFETDDLHTGGPLWDDFTDNPDVEGACRA